MPATKVTRVEITSQKARNAIDASNAKVYVGDKLVGTLPDNVLKSKIYVFHCDIVADLVKIVTGRNDIDQKLTFVNVELYGTNNPAGYPKDYS